MRRFILAPAAVDLFVRLTVILLVGGWATSAHAVPVFFSSSGTDPNGDLAFQGALGTTFAEEDFESFLNAATVTSFPLGGVDVGVSDTSVINPSIFNSVVFDSPAGGGQAGTVQSNSLLFRGSEATFSFSVPILGFGLWFFDDDTGAVNAFEMSANGGTSNIIDGNPGEAGFRVDGFLGVIDSDGITSLTVRNVPGGLIEVDHIQLATFPTKIEIPEPSTLALFTIGLVGLGALARRRRNKFSIS